MKIKYLFLIFVIVLMTGCGDKEYKEKENDRMITIYTGFVLSIYVDNETCIEYLSRANGGIIAMYDSDGNIKLNNKCLSNEGIEYVKSDN